jgi:CheY-like chemotaxis protein
MANIVIVDDDMGMDVLTQFLQFRGHRVRRIATAAAALDSILDLTQADLIVLDVIMPWPPALPVGDMTGNHSAGMEVFKAARAVRADLPILCYSATQDGSVKNAIRMEVHSRFVSKFGSPSLEQLCTTIHQMLGVPFERMASAPFIVHGQSEVDKLELKNFLQNSLQLPEPVILHEQPNLGRTIIEKFEDYALATSLVFVLLTPDDLASPATDPNDKKWRGRQNVIFEMGYFLGILGRRSGRVLLLHKGPLELPTDIQGIVYIDITHGIKAAGELIRRELAHVL